MSVLAALLLLVAGPGTRLGVWDFRAGLGLLKWAAYAGIAGVVLALAALAARASARGRGAGGGAGPLAVALLLAAVAAAVPLRGLQRARTVPPIHDITTDTADPPAWAALRAARDASPNGAAYGGDSVAAQQRRGYPDLAPLHLDAPPGAAFGRAVAAARAMGWEVAAADSAAGRVEATATTRWFGFKDDVVVRLRPDGAGTRVDVRSASRVGGSDVGANADRVRAYLARLTRG